jgi:hypothetical protein
LTTANTHSKHREGIRRGVEFGGDRSRRKPKRRSTPDLIGEARISKSTWWKRKREVGRIVLPGVGGGSHRKWPGSTGGGGDIGRRRGLRRKREDE